MARSQEETMKEPEKEQPEKRRKTKKAKQDERWRAGKSEIEGPPMRRLWPEAGPLNLEGPMGVVPDSEKVEE